MRAVRGAVLRTRYLGMDHSVHIAVRDLSLGYGSYLVMEHVSFDVRRGDVFVIMGGSGSGKSTLLNALIGLLEPAAGEIFYNGESFTRADAGRRRELLRQFGVLFQFGALWSSLTLIENVTLPLEELTTLGRGEIHDLAELKLALVGLGSFVDFYPDQISGGMRKRAGLARAMALDPELLFFDEPSSGLDPVSARRLDDLILELRDSLGTTVVVISHDLASIFAIADDGIYLDAKTKTVTAKGDPKEMRARPPNPEVGAFLTRSA
ncbi:MAG TPA: ATP-binding cassette domain-containing protein, partial [Kofleriaceae bacterium]|nr:ATP-binding cassette domain-containing protein [Kofleriaceae bacterium]